MSNSRFIVISGVSRGLGRAMTDGFVRAGHTVAGCARSKQVIADMANPIGLPHHFDVLIVDDNSPGPIVVPGTVTSTSSRSTTSSTGDQTPGEQKAQ